MAKPTGGLLAFGSSGSIAKTMVYSSWRGISYVRKHVIPANPKTTSQTQTRAVFQFLSAVWKTAPTLFQEIWTLQAQGQPFTNRNAFNKANIAGLRTATTLANLIFSGGAKGGLALTSVTVTPGATQLALTCVVPSPPVGWTLVGVIHCVYPDQDPHVAAAAAFQAAENDVTPYSHTFTGLTTGHLYRTSSWPKWTKPDLSTAYGPGLNGSGTPT